MISSTVVVLSDPTLDRFEGLRLEVLLYLSGIRQEAAVWSGYSFERGHRLGGVEESSDCVDAALLYIAGAGDTIVGCGEFEIGVIGI